MTIRKALVLVSGQIQQLQSGDTLGGPVADTEQTAFTNDDSGSHVIGDIVYNDGNDTVKKAQANAGGTVQAIGMATATIAASASGNYQTGGIVSGLSALTAGSVYYLSASTAGQMSTTAPSTPGQYVVRMGTAVSTTEFKLNIQPPVLL